MRFRAVRLELRHVPQILGRVHERSEAHIVGLRQEAQQVERPDLVALVRGKRDSVNEKQHGFHGAG